MKEVRKFLKKNPPTKVDVTGARGEQSIAYMLTNRSAILGPNRDILYILSYEDTYHYSKFIPANCLTFGEVLYKIEDIIEHVFEPTRFMAELTHIEDRMMEDWYVITIDGEEVHRTISSSKSSRARNQFLRERKNGKVDFKHLKIIDPAGNRTDFVFPRAVTV